MKFVCERSALLKILVNVSRSVSLKSNLIALEGIHLSVRNSLAEFEGFNMEFGIKTSLAVENAEEGEVVVPAKIFTDIVKRMPDSLVTVASDDVSVFVSCLDCDFVIPAISSSEFPSLPCIDDERQVSISSATLKNMIQQTIFSVSSDIESGIYSGELLEINDRVLTMVAIDGFRMAVRKEHVDVDTNFKIVIPGKALSEVLRLLPIGDENVRIHLSERYVFFNLGGYVFLSRLLDGDFIDYASTIPSECTTKVKLNVVDAIASAERVSVVIDDRLQSPIKAVIEPESNVKLSCSTPLGKSSDELSAVVTGEILEIAFNDRYFLDALKNCDTDEVMLEFTSALRPIKIVPLQGDSFVFLVLPVRMRDDE